jgi:REP element-mobilizing transposase RayT
MPRQARIKSSTGIYHVMIRGINKEKIFEKDVYKGKSLKIIREIKEEIDFSIIAYCIMDNHMHLLIQANENNLTEVMMKLDVKYAMYYNYFEERYGHVFQNRFKSEVVEDKKYLLCALRYIHNNPVKANMVDNIVKYNWSSVSDYIDEKSEIVSEKYLKWIMSLFKDKDEFIKFHNNFDDNLYLDIKEEQTENIQNIVSHVIEQYAKELGIDKSQFNHEHKENIAKKLLRYEYIAQKLIAEVCNLSQYKISEINKKL